MFVEKFSQQQFAVLKKIYIYIPHNLAMCADNSKDTKNPQMDGNGQKQTETDRNRQKLIQTKSNGQQPTETDRNKQKRTEIDRNG